MHNSWIKQKAGLFGFKKENSLSILRWGISIVFFFLGLSKALMISKLGLEPYQAVVKTVGFPEMFKYYGVLAVLIELVIAIGVWFKPVFRSAIVLTVGFSVLGTALSVYSLVFKLNSDCGCGLLGDNEYSLLVQKTIIIIVLVVLYRNEKILFECELNAKQT